MNAPNLLRICVGRVLFAIALSCLARLGVSESAALEPASDVGAHAGQALIPAGSYRPQFGLGARSNTVALASFWLDIRPVTVADYLRFLEAKPQWRRSQTKRLFADQNYLAAWRGDLDPGFSDPQALQRPVAQVSWFAAKAYAAWVGKRLPTTDEWEYAASAGFTDVDGRRDAAFQKALNRWYNTPSPETLPTAGSGQANVHGVRDLHGLIWEWTSDFNSSMSTGDARGDTGLERQWFCGGGAIGAANTSDYPAFMRYGFRSSLKAAFTVHNLGFRCAADAATPAPSKAAP